MNPLAPQISSPKKNVTIGAIHQALPHPDPLLNQARRVDGSEDSSITTSDDDDDDDDRGSSLRPKTASGNFPKQPAVSTLSHSAIFSNTQDNETDSDEDSIEAAISRLNTPKGPNAGIQGLVNQQIGNVYGTGQQSLLPKIQPPTNEDYSTSTSSILNNKEPPSKGVNSLVNQLPLLIRKPSEPTWDDSRPLSADLERNSARTVTHFTSSSDDSDDADDKKSITIVKSPLRHGVVASHVQSSLRPAEATEVKPSGVENLTKIIDAIMHSSSTNQNQ